MSILSLEFIVLTLGTVILYYIVPLKIRWWVLLLASGVFYAMAGWQGCIWLVLTGAVTFLSSLLQQKLREKEQHVADIESAIQDARERADAVASSTEEGMVWSLEKLELPTLPEKGWFSSAKKVKKLRKLLLAVSSRAQSLQISAVSLLFPSDDPGTDLPIFPVNAPAFSGTSV